MSCVHSLQVTFPILSPPAAHLKTRLGRLKGLIILVVDPIKPTGNPFESAINDHYHYGGDCCGHKEGVAPFGILYINRETYHTSRSQRPNVEDKKAPHYQAFLEDKLLDEGSAIGSHLF